MIRTTSIVCALLVATTSFALDVPLTIEEESGFDRINEPMTVGIPLPEGQVSAASALTLLDKKGAVIPCQITEVAKWLDGKSIKWVHATWLQSIKAKEKISIKLTNLTKAQKAKTPLKVTKAGGKVTVETGYVKFVVSGSKFNGFESAWFDASGKNNFKNSNQVIKGTGGGSHLAVVPKDGVTLENEHPKITGKTVPYSSVNDAEGKVTIEEQGSHRVVVKATGKHVGADGHALDYTIRFYAYAGSPVVRVQHVFVSRQGAKSADFHWMGGLDFSVPTVLAGGKVTIGTEGTPVSVGSAGQIYQDNSDHFSITSGGKEVASGKGKSSKPVTTGWLDMSKGQLGLAVGVKWFWQMHPKQLEARKDGMLRVGLYGVGARPLEVYRGQSRTHYMTFVFHGGKTSAQQLNGLFAGEQRPLRAWASPKYYCRDTHAFSYAAENDKSLFRDEDWPNVEKHNSVVLKSLQMLLKKIDGNTYAPVTRDSYGIYAWGDRFHWGWKNFGQAPVKSHQWRQSWAGNYYDYPNSMLMQFLRTKETVLLNRYWASAIQIGDVHTTNWHPKKKLIGACRYCPPRNFVATDNGKVYSSNEFNHHKSQSVYAHWYLTGDRRSLEHCELLANNALLNHDADSGWAARGIGHQIASLWNAYELWRDPKYFHRMKGLAYKAMKQFKNGKYRKGGFHDGIANQGLCYYYWVSGDQAVIDTFLAGYPKSKNKSRYPNMALGAAMTWRVTGKEEFRAWAWKALGRKKPSSRVHGPATQMRGNESALFFLSKASEGWKPYKNPLLQGK